MPACRVFISVSSGIKIIKSYHELPYIVENKMGHFHSLRCNEVNFHGVLCFTVMT